MFAGEKINVTEKRAVLHTALAQFLRQAGAGRRPGRDAGGHRHAANRCSSFAADVREGRVRGALGQPMTDVINIGIGGSDLGPAMAPRALSPFAPPQLRMPFRLQRRRRGHRRHAARSRSGADAVHRLIEDLHHHRDDDQRANRARLDRRRRSAKRRCTTISPPSRPSSTRSREFGIQPTRVFGFWDWVGGRYSVWSSIGLPLVIAIGPDRFQRFLAGRLRRSTSISVEAPIERNIPMLMGLLGVWHRNVLRITPRTRSSPTTSGSRAFPPISSSSRWRATASASSSTARRANTATGPVVWGEPGTNGQHAFFQLIHQGTDDHSRSTSWSRRRRPTHDAHHHDLLVANCLAQSEALMHGRTLEEAEAITHGRGERGRGSNGSRRTRAFPATARRARSLYRRLDPRTLGRLIALYEHKVFVRRRRSGTSTPSTSGASNSARSSP